MHNQISECHGFGPLYSGIFIISCCLTVYTIYKYIRKKKFDILIPYILILMGMVILVLATDGSWWARYTPYLYLMPIFNIIYLLNNKKKLSKAIAVILIILLVINVSLIIYANASKHLKKYIDIKQEFEEFVSYVESNSSVNVMLKTTGHEGLKYNIADLNIDMKKINFVNKIDKDKSNVYLFWYQRTLNSN